MIKPNIFCKNEEIQKREERNSLFFIEDGTANSITEHSTDFWLDDVETKDIDTEFVQNNQQYQDSVLLQIEDADENVKLASEREHQVNHIVKSISELHHVFKVYKRMI